VAVLGKDAYDALSLEDHRMLDLFIWGSCCMHEDLNSFKGGNTEMMAEWKKLNAAAPVLLTNKAKTAVPQQIFILFNFFALTTLWQPRFELAGLLLLAELRAWLNCLFQILFDKNT
jgi:hypothetical protein